MITIKTGDSKEDGGCIACLKHWAVEGKPEEAQHKIHVIDFDKTLPTEQTTGIQIRLCSQCLRELQTATTRARYA